MYSNQTSTLAPGLALWSWHDDFVNQEAKNWLTPECWASVTPGTWAVTVTEVVLPSVTDDSCSGIQQTSRIVCCGLLRRGEHCVTVIEAWRQRVSWPNCLLWFRLLWRSPSVCTQSPVASSSNTWSRPTRWRSAGRARPSIYRWKTKQFTKCGA